MVEKSKEYISCLANDKVGICVISLVLDRRHLKSDNKYPIALRFTIDRKRLYYSLGEKYTEKEFDAIVEQRILVVEPVQKMKGKRILNVKCN